MEGRIKPVPEGTEIEVVFAITRGLTLAIAFLFVGATCVVLANTGGSPLLRDEHLFILTAFSITCGGCFVAFRMDAARSESLLRHSLGGADTVAELKAEEAERPPQFTWLGLLARILLVSLIVPSAGGLIYLGVETIRSHSSKIAGALLGIPMICVGLIFLMPLGGVMTYATRIWMFVGRIGPVGPSEDPRRTHLD